MEVTLSKIGCNKLEHGLLATIRYCARTPWFCIVCSTYKTGIFYEWYENVETVSSRCCEDCATVENE